MTNKDFWNTSWESIDVSRIAEYIQSFDMQEDDIISVLREHGAASVCDAGCGCGIYTAKLAANGFSVKGFDVSAHAVEIARSFVQKASLYAELKTASILETGYEASEFDCVISRDVLDHVSKADAILGVRELLRITKPGGIVIFTLDSSDEEYETEPHYVSADGDYIYTDGKWNGMIFHPYSEQEVYEIIPSNTACKISKQFGEITVILSD